MVALREPEPFRTLETAGQHPRALEHFKRGIDLTNTGDFAGALREYDTVLALMPSDPYILTNRGAVLGRLGDHQGAIADFDAALWLRPDLPEALNNRGNARARLGDHQGAIADFDAALRLRPDYPEALYNLSLALRAANRHNEALAAINRYLALRPDDAEAKALHREVLDKVLRGLVDEGFMRGAGGKPKGMKRPVKLKPGPPISDYIVEERERLRN